MLRKSIIEETHDGNYILSEYGIYKSYLETMKKLVYFYCTRIEKMDKEKAKKNISKLQKYLRDNFSDSKSLYKYISGAANATTVSNRNKLLLFFKKNLINNLEVYKRTLKKQAIEEKHKKKDDLDRTSIKLLEQFGQIFQKAKPLLMSDYYSIIRKQEEEKEEKETLIFQDKISKILPSDRLLSRYELLFQTSMDQKKINKTDSSINKNQFILDAIPKSKITNNITLYDIVNLKQKFLIKQKQDSNKIALEWLKSLPVIKRIILYIVIYLRKETTGKKVNWPQIIDSLKKQGENIKSYDILALKSLIKKYNFIETEIKVTSKKIKDTIPDKMDVVKQIYVSLLNTSSDNENIDSKLDSIKVIIYDLPETKKIEAILREFLTKLDKIYR